MLRFVKMLGRSLVAICFRHRCQPDYEFATHIRCIRPTAYYDLGMKGLRNDAAPVMRKNFPSNEYVAHGLYRRDPW